MRIARASYEVIPGSSATARGFAAARYLVECTLLLMVQARPH